MKRGQIIIAGDIGPSWWDMIDDKTVSDQLVLLKDAEEIEVLINSPGGFVDCGLGIFNRLIEAGKSQKIITKNIGQCSSIAALIFLSGQERVMMPGTKCMIHHASSGEWGKADDLRKKADELEAESNNIFNLMILRSDKLKENEAKLREYFDAEKFIFADECVELGLAHKVEELPKAFSFSPNQMFNTMSKDLNKLGKLMKKMEDFLSGKKMASVQTDGDNAKTIYYDGELKEGTAVYSDEAMTTALSDGDYVVNGVTYTVAAGKVSAVSDPSTDESEEAKAKRLKEEAATAAANAEKVLMQSMTNFADGEYTVNGKTYVVKDKQVSMKIDTNDITTNPAFVEMKKQMNEMNKKFNDVSVENQRLKQENTSVKSEMKEIVKEIKSIGFGEGLGDDANVPAGYEMKNGKLVKKDPKQMSQKERLLMVAETMESQRERN